MTTNPPDAPVAPDDPATDGPHQHGHPDGHPDGPRVTREEMRDLARLRRSYDDRKIAGVAGGLARHFDIDPIIPRVVLVVLAFFGGAGLIVYGVIWLLVPLDGTTDSTVRLDDRSRSVALVVAGVVAALAALGDSLGGWDFPWPLAVVGVIGLVAWMSRGRRPRVHPLIEPAAPPTGYAGPAVMTRRRGPILFWYTLALIAVALGVLGIVDLAGAAVTDSAYPALALGICAATLLLGAFWGRAGGVILLGLLAAVATAGAGAATEIDTGRIEATPTSAAAVQDRYDLTFGVIDLDLTEVADPASLDGRTIEAEVEVAGRIQVVVPQDLVVVVESRLDAGSRRVFGADSDESGLDTDTVGTGSGDPELTLDVRVALGEIEIIRSDETTGSN